MTKKQIQQEKYFKKILCIQQSDNGSHLAVTTEKFVQLYVSLEILACGRSNLLSCSLLSQYLITRSLKEKPPNLNPE